MWKGKIHKTIVQPAMIYAMETVPLTARQERKLEVAEMRMCRWACGWTRLDHVRNETVRERLKIEKVTVLIRKARLRWYGHIERRGGDHVALRTLHMASARKPKERETEKEMERQHQRGYGEHRGGA